MILSGPNQVLNGCLVAKCNNRGGSPTARSLDSDDTFCKNKKILRDRVTSVTSPLASNALFKLPRIGAGGRLPRIGDRLPLNNKPPLRFGEIDLGLSGSQYAV